MEANKMNMSVDQGIFSLLSKRHVTCCCQCRPKSIQRLSLWKTLCLPRVSASEISTATDRLVHKPDPHTFVSELEVQEYLSKETGRDRLQMMYSRDHMHNFSPEIQFITKAGTQVTVITLLVSQFISGRHARAEWIAKHKASAFKTRYQAYKALQEQVFLRSLKEGGKWTLKVTVFSVLFFLTSQSIAVYQNKTTPWEYVIGCAVTGGLFKINLGLKGMFAASIFGGATGLIPGLLIFGAMRAMNETQEQRHYWQVLKKVEFEKAIRGEIRSPETGEQIQPQPYM